MLQAVLKQLNVSPGDVQVWECDPLLILDGEGNVGYGQSTKIEFTPFMDSSSFIGHAIALKESIDGKYPEIKITLRQYSDNPIELGRRQGITLTGTDQHDNPVTWLISGAADRFLTTDEAEQVDYDEETARILEEELKGEPDKVNLNTYI